jgi:RNA polymerase sigma-70 factor (ECF subfamily)
VKRRANTSQPLTFAQVYEAHVDFVWRTLRHLGVPAQDLADVCQEVFIVIHRQLPAFEGRSRITTWIFQICINHARDRARKAHVRHEVLADNGLDRVPAVARDPLAELEHKTDLVLFQGALEAMNLDQRATFILFEIEGMSGAEVAEALQVPIGTAYTRLRLARQAFHEALDRAEGEASPLLRQGGTR